MSASRIRRMVWGGRVNATSYEGTKGRWSIHEFPWPAHPDQERHIHNAVCSERHVDREDSCALCGNARGRDPPQCANSPTPHGEPYHWPNTTMCRARCPSPTQSTHARVGMRRRSWRRHWQPHTILVGAAVHRKNGQNIAPTPRSVQSAKSRPLGVPRKMPEGVTRPPTTNFV